MTPLLFCALLMFRTNVEFHRANREMSAGKCQSSDKMHESAEHVLSGTHLLNISSINIMLCCTVENGTVPKLQLSNSRRLWIIVNFEPTVRYDTMVL
jgi:hypothetical protein